MVFPEYVHEGLVVGQERELAAKQVLVELLDAVDDCKSLLVKLCIVFLGRRKGRKGRDANATGCSEPSSITCERTAATP